MKGIMLSYSQGYPKACEVFVTEVIKLVTKKKKKKKKEKEVEVFNDGLQSSSYEQICVKGYSNKFSYFLCVFIINGL